MGKGKGPAAGHDGLEMVPVAAAQPLPVAEEGQGRAALPGGGDDGGEASED